MGTGVSRVDVGGHRGAYISGGPHAYVYITPGGGAREDRALLAGPRSIWQRNGRVLRLEGPGDRRKLLQIATSVTP